MRRPVLRPAPSLADVAHALRTEVGQHGPGAEQVPHLWTVLLSPYDLTRAGPDYCRHLSALRGVVAAGLTELDATAAGQVDVELAPDPDLRPGHFRVVSAAGKPDPVPPPSARPLPGRPRLVRTVGGSARFGRLDPTDLDREIPLGAGRTVIGRGADVDVRLDDTSVSPRHVVVDIPSDGSRVRLRDLGSLNGTTVDGVPTVAFDLVDGNRIQLGATTLLYHRDDENDDGGRQGGETSDMVG